MEFYTLSEGRPTFDGSLGMWDTEDIFPRCLLDLDLEDLFPWLSSFIRKKVSLEFKWLCSGHRNSKLCFFDFLGRMVECLLGSI